MRKAAFGIAIGLGVLAVCFGAVSLVLRNQANFSKQYVHDQLAEKQITFTPVEGLLPNQKTVPCLVENAGRQLVTGKQAECYARYQIGLDLALVDHGKTYFEDHYAAYLLRVKAQQALATSPNDPATQELVQQSATLSRVADDLAAGEAMRGLLLTAYGFSLLGDRGATAALTCLIAAIGLAVGALVSLAVGLRSNPGRSVEPAAAGPPVGVVPVAG
jgi:hypothetical protein